MISELRDGVIAGHWATKRASGKRHVSLGSWRLEFCIAATKFKMASELTSSRNQLRRRIEDLLWWLGTAEKAGNSDAYDGETIHRDLAQAVAAVKDAAKTTNDLDPEDFLEEEHAAVKRCLDELRVIGLADSAAPPHRSSREIFRDVPESLCASLNAIVKSIQTDEERTAERDRDYEAVQRALKNDVFLDFVRRNPGKGCWQEFPSFDVSVTFDSIGGYPQSWTRIDVYAYSRSVWVVGRTYMHIEAEHLSFTEFEQVSPGVAARMLLRSDAALDVDQLIWLKQVAEQDPELKKSEDRRISWNRELGELWLDGNLARKIAQPNRATQVVTILNVFEEEEWPERVDSPFPASEEGKQTLRETLRSLNKGAKGIQFTADGTGEGIRYRIVEAPGPDPF